MRIKFKNLIWLFLVVMIAIWVQNFMHMGIPGIHLFLLFDSLSAWLFGPLHGDNLHPIGIKFGFIWPILPFIAIGFGNQFCKHKGEMHLGVFVASLVAASLLVAVVLRLGAQ